MLKVRRAICLYLTLTLLARVKTTNFSADSVYDIFAIDVGLCENERLIHDDIYFHESKIKL